MIKSKARESPIYTNKKTLNATQTRLTVRFKRVRDIDGFALLVSHRRAIDMTLAGLYRTAVHDDRRAVVSYRGHRTAWHVLVASRQGYVGIIVLGLGEGSRVSSHLKPQRDTVRTIVTCFGGCAGRSMRSQGVPVIEEQKV